MKEFLMFYLGTAAGLGLIFLGLASFMGGMVLVANAIKEFWPW